jgi:DNA topoisomerase-1
MGATYKSLGRGDDVLSIGLNRAVVLLAEVKVKAARGLGAHPADGKPVTLRHGRFGPYVAHGSLRASLPRGTTAEAVTLDEALALLTAKAAKGGAGKPARKGAGGGARRRPATASKAG